jgi:hypothetical protein
LAVGFLPNSGCFFGVVGVLLCAILGHGLPPSPPVPSGGSAFPFETMMPLEGSPR